MLGRVVYSVAAAGSAEGVVDVIELGEAFYQRLARVPTVPGARTSPFVPELDRLFVALRAASNEPAATCVFRPAHEGRRSFSGVRYRGGYYVPVW
jgi:hypothetical protein